MKLLATSLFTLALTIVFISGTAQAESTFVSIGTGSIHGIYYPTGGAIAKMVNKNRNKSWFRVTVESTGGSIYNIDAIMAGDLDFGVVQSDSQFQAMNGTGAWKVKGPQTELRAVFSIHPEAVTLIVAADTGIKHITDLKGRRVSIGNPGSGQRHNAIDALTAVGINYETDLIAESSKASEAASLLQDNQIDAFFHTIGHPSGSTKNATSGARKVVIADITGVESLLNKVPYYTKATIPIKLYPGAHNEKDIKTFGVKATLVTSTRTSDDIVYTMTKEVFENIETLKKLHPAYATLSKESMLTGLSAPIHPGAMKYFKEVGLR